MIIVDATDLILGRMATFVAKQALLGQEVKIINVEKTIISGNKKKVAASVKQKMERGTPAKGPFIPKKADRFVRRTIRGMLPYKLAKGAEAYKRVLCYVGVPKELEGEKAVSVPNAEVKKLPTLKYISVEEVLKLV